jgi:predicted transcriptional regulator
MAIPIIQARINLSQLLQTVQKAIAESGLSHDEIAKRAGIQRVRVTEWANKKDFKVSSNMEKILKALKPDEFEKFVGKKLEGTGSRTQCSKEST